MSCIGALRGLKDNTEFHRYTREQYVEIEDTPATAGRLEKELAAFRKILIEVKCNVDTACTNGRQHAEQKKIHHQAKPETTGEGTDNGHETAVWEVMQKNTEERRYVHHEKNNRV